MHLPVLLNIASKIINSLAGILVVFVLQDQSNLNEVVKFYWLFALFQSYILFELGINNVIVRELNPLIFNSLRKRLRYLKKNIFIISFTSIAMVLFISIVIGSNTNYSFELTYVYILMILPILLILNIYVYSYDAIGAVKVSALIRFGMSISSALALSSLYFFDVSIALLLFYLTKMLFLLSCFLFLSHRYMMRMSKILFYLSGRYNYKNIINPIKIGLTNILGYWLSGGIAILLDDQIIEEKEHFFGYYISIFMIILYLSNIYLSTFLFKFYEQITSTGFQRNEKLKFYIVRQLQVLFTYVLLCAALTALALYGPPQLDVILPFINAEVLLLLFFIFALHLSLIIDAYVLRASGNEKHYKAMIFILVVYFIGDLGFDFSLTEGLVVLVIALTACAVHSKRMIVRQIT